MEAATVAKLLSRGQLAPEDARALRAAQEVLAVHPGVSLGVLARQLEEAAEEIARLASARRGRRVAVKKEEEDRRRRKLQRRRGLRATGSPELDLLMAEREEEAARLRELVRVASRVRPAERRKEAREQRRGLRDAKASRGAYLTALALAAGADDSADDSADEGYRFGARCYDDSNELASCGGRSDRSSTSGSSSCNSSLDSWFARRSWRQPPDDKDAGMMAADLDDDDDDDDDGGEGVARKLEALEKLLQAQARRLDQLS